MMNRYLPLALVTGILMLSHVAIAEPLSISSDDSIQSVLSAQKDKRVTLRLKSGSELSGTVGEVNDNIVHIKQITGKEFFDAAVALKGILAVEIRTRDR
jgi:hypothetical protein